jgi:phosphoribosyl 1,2-cyclic phosphodiesterase
MKITTWGTRGSIPVSGARFARYGGATTCLEIITTGDGPSRIVIDGGTGLAELARCRADGWNNTLVLQTHVHWDHIQGFPFLTPLFDPSAAFEFWVVDRDGVSFESVLNSQMKRPTFPVALSDVPASLGYRRIDAVDSRQLGSIDVAWTELVHPSGSTAYRVSDGELSVVFTGDCEVKKGCLWRLIEFARGADLLVMDAQYFPDEYRARAGWGHSTPVDAVDVAIEAGVGRLLLTHHDPAHDDERLEAKLALARRHAAGRVLVDNAFDGMQVELGMHSTARVAP